MRSRAIHLFNLFLEGVGLGLKYGTVTFIILAVLALFLFGLGDLANSLR
jgi:hypothetical protein